MSSECDTIVANAEPLAVDVLECASLSHSTECHGSCTAPTWIGHCDNHVAYLGIHGKGLDLTIHTKTPALNSEQIQQTLNDIRKQYAVVPTVDYNRFQHSFSHIFAGGYAAGYYSYKWAEVLSADAWSAFEEAGIFDPDTGQRFREEILEQGGARDAAELFRAFRGREPSVEPLLRHSGIRAA